jgi:xylose isomerase
MSIIFGGFFMNEKVKINVETTKQELISKAYHLLTAISTMAESIEGLDFNGDASDLECDTVRYTSSIKELAQTAQDFLFHVNGEI